MGQELSVVLGKFITNNKGTAEEISIIEDAFSILTLVITYAPDTKQIENIVLNNLKINFLEICLFGLLNDNQSLRIKFSNSLINLTKHCARTQRFDIIAYLFSGIFDIIISVSSSDNTNTKNSAEIFELFSYIFEIYLLNTQILESKLKQDIKPQEYILKFATALGNDINGTGKVLSSNIFIGYLKILSKVVQSIPEIKKKLSTPEYNLIQGLMTKVLFKQSSKELKEMLQQMEYINPDKYDDNNGSRNADQNLRTVCYNFILAMLNGSIENFEKFFSINVLESDNTKVAKQENLRTIFSNNVKQEGFVGLRNLGCICYMNSMLQQFFMVPIFRYCLLQVNDYVSVNKDNALSIDDNVFHQVQRMFSYLEMSNREDYVPHSFCFSYKDWEGNPTNVMIQQDAQEFLTRFIDKVEDALKPTEHKYLLQSVFGGKTCSQLVCEQGCGTSKNRYEDFTSLSLEVNNMKNIYDSLEKFISPEKIDEYNCDTCNSKVTITKRNVLAELPNVLIVHLQRIFYNYEIDRNEKINSKLEFPKLLNLKNYTMEELTRRGAAKRSKGEVDDENNDLEDDEVYFKSDDYYEYHLVGVNVHIGSADAGHYFSYINSVRGGKENTMNYNPQEEAHVSSWLKFNDSRISKFK